MISIDDILKFVFDDSFEKKNPKLAKAIRKEEMYQVLVEEIQILKEEYHSLEKVKEELRRQTEKTRSHITKILADKKMDE